MTDWDRNRHALRRHLKTDKLENFLRWSTVEKTMFVGDVGFVHKEYNAIMTDRYYRIGVIAESGVGNPKLLAGWTSGNLIHQYYHLKQWLDRSIQPVSKLSSIVEVGAGYGTMALICRRLGFKGWYHIIDFPELIQIQRYYLRETTGKKDGRWSTLDRFYTDPCDLFIALHSLGEMPIAERERLLSRVQADAYLFASSYEFEGVDNQTWFREFGESRPGYRWAQWAHPFQENCFYQVGVRV